VVDELVLLVEVEPPPEVLVVPELLPPEAVVFEVPPEAVPPELVSELVPPELEPPLPSSVAPAAPPASVPLPLPEELLPALPPPPQACMRVTPANKVPITTEVVMRMRLSLVNDFSEAGLDLWASQWGIKRVSMIAFPEMPTVRPWCS